MGIVPSDWMPEAAMVRVICHWTGGGHLATNLDRSHYHIMVEADGRLVPGAHAIKDNERIVGDQYAAHTLGTNTGSIGVAVCCMAGAREAPFASGPYPMTEIQWETMAQVVAELCARYGIPVTPQTVLAHGEVQAILKRPQRGKWDPLVLPWAPGLSRQAVGNRFRERVLHAMGSTSVISRETGTRLDRDEEAMQPLSVVVNGRRLMGGVSSNEGDYLKISSLADGLAWELRTADRDVVVFRGSDGRLRMLDHAILTGDDLAANAGEADILDRLRQDGYVGARSVAEALGLPLVRDLAADTLTIGTGVDQVTPQTIKVRKGDTLYRIAERYYGRGALWTALRNARGQPFRSSTIRVGQVIQVPPPGTPITVSMQLEARKEARGSIDVDLASLIGASNSAFRAYAEETIPLIIAACAANGVEDRGQIAYVLATSEHESGCGRWTTEIGNEAYFAKYDGRIGNKDPGDGFRYRGRGFVQLTGRGNYARWAEILKMDLLANPDLVSSDLRISAQILVRGMKEGLFRGRRLDQFIAGPRQDFYGARSIINGDKDLRDRRFELPRGARVAAIAERYLDSMGANAAVLVQGTGTVAGAQSHG